MPVILELLRRGSRHGARPAPTRHLACNGHLTGLQGKSQGDKGTGQLRIGARFRASRNGKPCPCGCQWNLADGFRVTG